MRYKLLPMALLLVCVIPLSGCTSVKMGGTTFHVCSINGDPIIGATIAINGSNYTTDNNGYSTISPGNGYFNYTITAPGFQDYTGAVQEPGTEGLEPVMIPN